MQLIDLTKIIYSGMTVFEGDPEVKVEQIHTIENQGWNLSLLTLGSHSGTHVDAPWHMDPKGAKLDDLSLDKFISKARLVSIEDQIFPEGIGLVFRDGIVDEKVVEKLTLAKPAMVVTGDSAHLPVESERILLKSGILTFTDLVNLDQLPSDREFTFYGIPLKIKNADGSPIRAFAVVDLS